MEMIKIKRALISVTNKNLIKDLAIELNNLGVEIYSTRGTSSFLKELGIKAFSIENYTGFPEILGGRVKTLHPKIFGGILARRDLAEHETQIQDHEIRTFDLVCVDLYPVRKVIAENADIETVVEYIDIGGISLIRASAKSFKDVAVLVDVADFNLVLDELKKTGGISYETRKRLSGKAFAHCSNYDKAINEYLSDDILPLRYGENPHQTAQYLKTSSWIKEVIRGEISYNNILDLDGAAELCFGLKFQGYKFVAVIVKHGSPCGVGVSEIDINDAFNKAWECDPISSYGGVLVLSEPPNIELLTSMKGKFVELICAPSYAPDFIKESSSRKKLKILSINQTEVLDLSHKNLTRSVCGGFLLQEKDHWWEDYGLDNDFLNKNFKVVSKKSPSEAEQKALKLAWSVSAITKSNAIVIASSDKVLGIGGGCVSRIDATNLAVTKTKQKEQDGGKTKLLQTPMAMASDGFLPFADSIESIIEIGVTAVIEPGGSIRDEDVIDACNKKGISLVFTGKRHFRH
jgi:phosphoribosylaminoimidazolecarboxamide formyltransferase / IMP cyclohydrolase